jgi:hypothetical protein
MVVRPLEMIKIIKTLSFVLTIGTFFGFSRLPLTSEIENKDQNQSDKEEEKAATAQR